MEEASFHRRALCVLCGCEAHRFLEVGDLTLYLCPAHVDLCVQCLVMSDEGIADQGNICGLCRGPFEDCYARLGTYECTPGCAVCEPLGS